METDASLSHERDQLLDHIMKNFSSFPLLAAVGNCIKTTNWKLCGRVSNEESADSTRDGLIKMSISRAEI
jgi:hypothetical protein